MVGAIVPWNAPTARRADEAGARAGGRQLRGAQAARAGAVHVHPPWPSWRSRRACPAGVLNVVPGGAEAGDAMVTHPGVGKVVVHRRRRDRPAPWPAPPATRSSRWSSSSAASRRTSCSTTPTSTRRCRCRSTCCCRWRGRAARCPTRLLVQRGIYDAVVDRASRAAERVRVGDPLDPGTGMGPVISRATASGSSA